MIASLSRSPYFSNLRAMPLRPPMSRFLRREVANVVPHACHCIIEGLLMVSHALFLYHVVLCSPLSHLRIHLSFRACLPLPLLHPVISALALLSRQACSPSNDRGDTPHRVVSQHPAPPLYVWGGQSASFLSLPKCRATTGGERVVRLRRGGWSEWCIAAAVGGQVLDSDAPEGAATLHTRVPSM